MRQQQGLGLIELVLAAAIIALLATLIVASARQARLKAADKVIKSQLLVFRNGAQLYYNAANRTFGPQYNGTCIFPPANQTPTFSDSIFMDSRFNLRNAVEMINQNVEDPNSTKCFAVGAISSPSASSWAIETPLKSDPAIFYCADSAGFFGASDGQLTTDYTSIPPSVHCKSTGGGYIQSSG